MNVKVKEDWPIFTAGLVAGGLIFGSIMYNFMLNGRRAFINRLIEESTLKTELLNWMVEEGIYLEGEEFYPQYQERAKFLNLVLHVEDDNDGD